MLIYREIEREGERERKISAENELQISFWSFVWGITFFTPLTLLNTATAPSLPLSCLPPSPNCCCCSFSHNVLRSTNYSQQQQKGVEIWAPDTPPLGRCQGVCAPLVGLFYLSCRCCLLNNLSPRSSTLPFSRLTRHAS